VARVSGLRLPAEDGVLARPISLARAHWQTAAAVAFFLTFVGLSLTLPVLDVQIFDSPDETSNYIYTKIFAEEGRVWYTNDLIPLDQENLLHFRGGLTHEGRVLFYSYLGLPVTYGFLYNVVGDNLQYISAVFAAVSAWALFRSTSILFGTKAWQAWAVLLAFTPLIYYLNRPYMNATPAMTFLFVAIWMFARYVRSSNRRDLFFAAVAATVVIAFRYEYVLFVTPLAAWGLYLKHKAIFSGEVLIDGAIYAGVLGVLFAIPLLYLNYENYGSFTTYGPGLHNQLYFPERTAEGVGMIEGAFRSLRAVLLPSETFDLKQMAKNIIRLTLFLMPVLAIGAVLGAELLIRGRRLSYRQFALLAMLVAYIFVYLGSSNTFNAEGSAASFNVAMVRYWLPIYTLMFFLAAYAVTAHPDGAVRLALIGGLLITGPASVLTGVDGSLRESRGVVQGFEPWAERFLLPQTEENAIVYAGKSDKRIVPFREVAAWWNGAEFYNPQQVAASMARVSTTGRPIYIYGEPEVKIPQLNAALGVYGLGVSWVEGSSLFRLGPAPEQGPMEMVGPLPIFAECLDAAGQPYLLPIGPDYYQNGCPFLSAPPAQ